MQPKSDAQLLREYADHGAETAFAEIVARHTNLVYSAALRQVNSPDIAAEIAQNVFAALARAARSLSQRMNANASLAGWLCRCARNLSLNHRRDEFRRHSRERLAMQTLDPTPDTPPDWEQLRPLLDEAMSELNDPDHDALVLRYFKNQDLRSVGQALNISDDAAQKRVSRAVERLRDYFTKRGVTVGAGGLTALISANAVQAAPAGLALTISTATAAIGTAVAATTTATATAATATKAVAMTTLQKTVIGATLAAAIGTGIHEARQASQLRERVQTFQQQQAPLEEQIRQLQEERDIAARQLTALREQNDRVSSNTSELLRLRGEATRLREQYKELERLRSENQRLLAIQNSHPVAPASRPDDLLEQSKRIARDKSFDGRNYATRLILFASENQGGLPTNWQQVARYAQQFPVSGTNEFEMIYKKPLNLDELGTNVHRTILIREYLAWPTPDGKWGKIYGFADGHSESVILDDGNFTAWEEQHTLNPEVVTE